MNKITVQTPQTAYLDMVKTLVSQSPVDEYGLLTYLIDFDYIPTDILDRPKSPDQEQLVNTAKIPLSMIEGYLAFDNIKPIWDKLNHEPSYLYDLFRSYLLMPNRNIHQLMEQIPAFTASQMTDTYYIYYWEFRAKVYDIHKPIAASKVRNQRILQMEDHDFIMATDIQNQAIQELNIRRKELAALSKDNIGRPFKDVHPVQLMGLIKDSIEIKRVANRLPAKGPASIEHQNEQVDVSAEKNLNDRVKQFNVDSTNGQDNEVVTQIKKNIAGNPDLMEKLQKVALEAMSNNQDNE